MTMRPMDDETFARLYAAQSSSIEEDLPLWLGLAREYGSPILEIGCGAGRVLRPLAEAGYSVTGLDTSPAMLRRAQRTIAGPLARRVRFVAGDVRRLDLEERFRLILSPCNTLAALDDGELAVALARAGTHLHTGGALAFEVPGPGEECADEVAQELVAAFVDDETGNPVQVSASQTCDPASGRVVVTWRYDELHPDGTVAAWTVPVPFHLRPPEAYARMLGGAGLRLTALYGDYHRRTLAPQDTRMIVVGVRED